MHSSLVLLEVSASTGLTRRSTLKLQDHVGLSVASVDCDRTMIGNGYHF